MKRGARWLALAVGVGIFAWYLKGTDLEEVGRALRRLGLMAPLLLGSYFVVYAVDTWAWRQSFGVPPRVGFWTLFRIRWCGEAVNNVVPTAYVGGEALKVIFLSRRGVPSGDATTAALVSKTAQTVAQVLFIAGGALAFLVIGVEHAGFRTGMVVVLAGGVGVVAMMAWLQRRGAMGGVLELLGRAGIRSRWLEARRAGWEAVDRQVAGFYRQHRGRFVLATLGYLVGWLLDTVEIWLAGWLLGVPIHWLQALAIEAFTGVVKVIGMWVPGALGVQESGIVLLARLAGAPGLLGATYPLLRRARELIYAAVGWVWLLLEPGRNAAKK